MTSSSVSAATVADAASDLPSSGNWSSPAYAWYVTSLLMFSYFLAYLDRTIINLLIEPIKRDLGLSDTQISLIVGSSFALFFAIAGIPLGRLADTVSRKWVVACSALIWSLMTALCGLAKGFLPLFAFRVGVGIGEAGLNPSAMSMISDYFPRAKRQLAITLFTVSGILGAGFAAIIGAGLLTIGEYLSANGVMSTDIRPWQWVFILVALPGVPLAAVMIFGVREPKRRGIHDEVISVQSTIPLPEVVRYYRERWRLFVPLLFGASIILTVCIGYLVWGIPLAQRTFGLEAKQAAIYLALPLFLCGVIGNFVNSYFGHFLTRKGYADGMMRAMLIVSLIAAIPVTLAPLISEFWLFMMVLAPFLGMLTAMSILPQIAIQFIVPNRLRGQTIALFYFVINIVSYSVGPTSVALLTDRVYGDEALLRYSLATISAIAFPLACALFVWGLPYFRAEAEAADIEGAKRSSSS